MTNRREFGEGVARAAALCLLALAAVLLRAGEARAQWTTSGANTTTTNNVGIGTSAPGANLDVQSPTGGDAAVKVYTSGAASSDRWASVSVTAAGTDSRSVINLTGHHNFVGYFADNDFTAGLNLIDSSSSKSFRLGLRPYTNSLNLFSDTVNSNGGIMTWLRSGLVGIGTASPGYKLDVQGGYTSSSSGYISRSNPWGTADSAFFPNGITTAGTSNWIYGTTTFINNAPSNGWGHQFQGANAYLAMGGGSVGVGTASPGYRLDVQGGAVNASGGLCIAGDCKTAWSQVGGGAAASQWTTNGTNISYSSGSVGIGSATAPSAPSRLTVFDTAQNAARLTLSGQEFYTPSNSSADGPALLLGVNRPNNKQLWIGDSAALAQNSTNAVLRVLVISGTVGIDAIGTDGLTPKPLSVGNGAGVTMSGGLDVSGTITGGNIQAKYQDVAEWVPSTQKLAAGTVVVLDAARTNHVVSSAKAYDTAVAGVVSDSPGVILGEGGEGKLKVATTGRVKVRVDATRAPIKVGDLLVTSEVEGVAMKSAPVDLGGVQIHRPGTIVGKALEPLEKGTGEILVLLSLQ